MTFDLHLVVCASEGMWTNILKGFWNLKFLKEGQPQTIFIFLGLFSKWHTSNNKQLHLSYIFPITEIIYIIILHNEKRIIDGFVCEWWSSNIIFLFQCLNLVQNHKFTEPKILLWMELVSA